MLTRLLRVTGSNFTAGAVWEKADGGDWLCKQAAPIIFWMLGRNPKFALDGLKRRGLTYEWVQELKHG